MSQIHSTKTKRTNDIAMKLSGADSLFQITAYDSTIKSTECENDINGTYKLRLF